MAHIACELHDDLSQWMALLQIGLSQSKQNLPSPSPQAKQELDKVAQTAREISLELRNLSHRLHPRNWTLWVWWRHWKDSAGSSLVNTVCKSSSSIVIVGERFQRIWRYAFSGSCKRL